MTARNPDWQEKFNDWRAKAMRRPFTWGKFDCALMAASCVEALTGVNPAQRFIGTYKTAKGSVRVLKKEKAKSLSDLGDQLLGEVIDPVFAYTGDVGLAIVGPLQTFVVRDGYKWLCIGEHGVMIADEDQLKVIRAWRT